MPRPALADELPILPETDADPRTDEGVDVPENPSAPSGQLEILTNGPDGAAQTVEVDAFSGANQRWEESYVLGPGDTVRIDALGAPDYSGESTVLFDGTLNLPAGLSLPVAGRTTDDTARAIEQLYVPYLRNPQVGVVLTALRPVQVGVVGAVERPGTYTVPIQANGGIDFPSLTDALGLAGGISDRADLRNVQVSRPSRSGQRQVLTVNLWNLLQQGDLSGDVLLRSGDTVSIPIAETIDPAEAARLGSASFAPESVTVYVVGEVTSPGPIQLPPNTPMNQALLAAGGFNTQRANNDEIGLVRLNPDGTVNQRLVSVDFTAGINEETNPLLRENDVLVVERSGIASFSDTVGLAVNPIGRLLNGIFNIFNFLD